ncbi:MAG TPA: DUF4874 domain-containing protein, partial [Cytophagaceae bacterium]
MINKIWVFLPSFSFSLGIAPCLAQTKTINYAADTVALFPNPERGWVHSINPGSDDSPSPDLVLSDLLKLKLGPDKVTLIRKYYLLKPFTNTAISQVFLDKFQEDLNTCKAAGMKLIPRFVYKWNPGGTNKDAPLASMLNHISQIEPYLERNVSVIAFLEAGMVGEYGEWHHSDWNYIDNYSNEVKSDGITVRDALLAALPQQRFLAMRYMFWHKYIHWDYPLTEAEAYSTTTQARIGYHHDYIMQNEKWDSPGCGICPVYETMHNYYALDSKWVPSTGEPCSGGEDSPYYQSNDPRPQLKSIHISTLVNNACIDYSYWKSKPWYDVLTRDLGYRLELSQVVGEASIRRDAKMPLQITILNTGYAAPFNPRKCELIFRDKISGAKYKIDLVELGRANDPRYWQPGRNLMKLEIPLPKNISPGEYQLLLNLADPTTELYEQPDYSIRLANPDVWEAATGYNSLKLNVRIDDITGMRLNKSVSQFTTFPNPANTELFLNADVSENSYYEIASIEGKILQSGEASEHAINIENL